MLSPDEVVELRAAGEMVRQMTEALGLRVAELPPAEQVHIMHSVLTAWQTRVARQQGLARIKLSSEANEIQESAVGIAEAEAQRRTVRDASQHLARELDGFRAAAADSMALGLAIWAILGGANVFAGLGMLCALPWAMHRAGLLRTGSADLPLTRLLLGLGLGCGAVGRSAVGRLGGGTTNWTLAWAAWVALHLALQWAAQRRAAHALCKAERAAGRAGRREGAGPASALQPQLGSLITAMYVLQSFALPALLAWSTFYAVDLDWL
ncbi:hypothetical protein QBZ16_000724 [Prototheca wickerhamii]|uniref:Uncharacterized protein n=1 Tax=Prototheca wickerhamii TaxID=3111 RepID=A0AAD9IPB5_PROWI|nr:hypothetical protein QBZ16_000724 [Prototheca wickerhamii]